MAAPFGNHNHRSHGLSHTRIDNIYKSMISRCYKKSSKNYERYGARGITVCEEWRNDKTKFFKWAFEHGYSDRLTIDRIDNNLGYSPQNCRWVSNKVQQNNRRNNRRLECRGQTHTMAEWADISGIKESTIFARLKSNWSVEDAIFTRLRGHSGKRQESYV